MRPFFSYYGGKWRMAPRYPAPVHDTVIEPFAGSAGYSVRHNARNVLLIDRSPQVIGTWDYLIRSSPDDIMALPDLEPDQRADELPVCQEAQWLVGWWLVRATTHPGQTMPAGSWAHRVNEFWGESARSRIASQVDGIRHWRTLLGSYHDAPDVTATWFVDPPYASSAGRRYRMYSTVDYGHLAAWCMSRRGQTIACDEAGSDWLPFRPLYSMTGAQGRAYKEVVWTSDAPPGM